MPEFDMKSFWFLLFFLFFISPAGAAVSSSSTAESVGQSSLPFASQLFRGNFGNSYFDGFNDDYEILAGDRVQLQMWGAQTFDGVLEVDARGNLFLPEIGPVKVEGLPHAKLESAIQEKIRSVFTSNVEVYVNLLNPQPVAVFVSGYVASPGRYAGGPTDSILFFIDLAGGIDAERGSYREIKILRNGEVIESIDLYPFVRSGQIQRPRLEDGDVVLVGERGNAVTVGGVVRHKAKFEFSPDEEILGDLLLQWAMPEARASHVSVVGSRGGAPYNAYFTLKEFADQKLEDGDQITFHADIPGDTIMVAAEGAIIGASRYPVNKSTKLKDLLSYIAVEPELANLKGIHLRRKSVALQQKQALSDALSRLEQSSLTATSSSEDEAAIRVEEAELIAKFVEQAKQIQPDGTVVVGYDGEISDIYLEDGDEIIIPAKSDVVLITGEVLMPQAVVWKEAVELESYIAGAGGYSDRADEKKILIVKPNGEVLMAKETVVAAGDQILVLPKYDSKNMQVLKDISEILYQIGIAASVALDL
jgi:protein involved in polysaccharide export with SLBB domain